MASLPLDTLIDLARKEMDSVTRELGARQAQASAAQQQLLMLEQYLHDYRVGLQSSQQQGLSAANWQNYQRFISVLEGAINEQRNVLQRAERQLHNSKLEWQGRKRRLSSFDALLDRRNRAEAVREARAEQRLNDEFAATRLNAQRAAHASAEANGAMSSSNSLPSLP